MQSVDDESELVRENTISLEAFFVVVHRRRAVGFSGGRGGGEGSQLLLLFYGIPFILQLETALLFQLLKYS